MLASELREKTAALREVVIVKDLEDIYERMLNAASHGETHIFLWDGDDKGCIDRLIANGYTVKKLKWFQRLFYYITYKVSW